jgi:hypothetical protein
MSEVRQGLGRHAAAAPEGMIKLPLLQDPCREELPSIGEYPLTQERVHWARLSAGGHSPRARGKGIVAGGSQVFKQTPAGVDNPSVPHEIVRLSVAK